MKHDYIYSHLNGLEFLIVHKKAQWKELLSTIESIDANLFLKYSDDKTKKGEVIYAQPRINNEFKKILSSKGWVEKRTPYMVSGDIATSKEIVKIKDVNLQKEIIESRGFKALPTNNQVDFVKDRIAVEVQFGKYFSVAYDLHVKHTFFFAMDDIDVGIEIIPTHEFMKRMDTGVAWYENEITNVIREGRSNPSVPIVIIGIEPEVLIPEPNAGLKKLVEKKRIKAEKQRVQAEEAKEKAEQSNSPTQIRRAEVLQEKVVAAERELKDAITRYEELETFKKEAAAVIGNYAPKKGE